MKLKRFDQINEEAKDGEAKVNIPAINKLMNELDNYKEKSTDKKVNNKIDLLIGDLMDLLQFNGRWMFFFYANEYCLSTYIIGHQINPRIMPANSRMASRKD